MYNASRHTLANKQQNRNYRPTNAPAEHVKRETQLIHSTDPVIEISSMYHEYWVASKFPGRYYHVIRDEEGKWWCSSSDDRVAAAMIVLARAYEIRTFAA